MNLSNFTIKSQESIQEAQQHAEKLGQQAIEPVHLLQGMMLVDENVIPFILKKVNASPDKINSLMTSLAESLPKVSGGQQYLGEAANKILQNAVSLAKTFGDEFVSLEHIFLSIVSSKDKVGQLLRNEGITEKDTKAAILELRKGNKVNSVTAEDTYNSLSKLSLIHISEPTRPY